MSISEWRRPFQWTPGTPVLWDGEPWPIRNPILYNACVGDVFAGNLEIHTRCTTCKRSGVIDPAELAARYEPTYRLRDLWERFYCRQCGQTVLPSMRFPRAPVMNGR